VSLSGKVALVTGGSRGIGKGIAKAFAAAGARVMITSRSAESCAETAKELGENVDFEPGHIGRPDDMERVIGATLERLGGLDVLVNNAATNPYAGPTIDVDLPRWQKTLEINLTAPLLWTQCAWRRALKERGGAVINISSVGGFGTNPILGVYDVTKAALVHLTKQLAAELGPKVRVNAIAPGLIKTDFARVLWDEGRGEQVAKAYPLKRLGEPGRRCRGALPRRRREEQLDHQSDDHLDGGGIISFSGSAEALGDGDGALDQLVDASRQWPRPCDRSEAGSRSGIGARSRRRPTVARYGQCPSRRDGFADRGVEVVIGQTQHPRDEREVVQRVHRRELRVALAQSRHGVGLARELAAEADRRRGSAVRRDRGERGIERLVEVASGGKRRAERGDEHSAVRAVAAVRERLGAPRELRRERGPARTDPAVEIRADLRADPVACTDCPRTRPGRSRPRRRT
jgi:NAD(P)-dependent dehydrogenase (short-subunit alcohol dehydrogenase family)